MGARSQLPLLGSDQLPMGDGKTPTPDPTIGTPTRDPPKTFAQVISGTTPHTALYDADGWAIQRGHPQYVSPIIQPTDLPSYPSERAGIPSSIKQSIDDTRGPNYVDPSRPVTLPSDGSEAMDVWDAPGLRASGTFCAVAIERTYSDQLESAYLSDYSSTKPLADYLRRHSTHRASPS